MVNYRKYCSCFLILSLTLFAICSFADNIPLESAVEDMPLNPDSSSENPMYVHNAENHPDKGEQYMSLSYFDDEEFKKSIDGVIKAVHVIEVNYAVDMAEAYTHFTQPVKIIEVVPDGSSNVIMLGAPNFITAFPDQRVVGLLYNENVKSMTVQQVLDYTMDPEAGYTLLDTGIIEFDGFTKFKFEKVAKKGMPYNPGSKDVAENQIGSYFFAHQYVDPEVEVHSANYRKKAPVKVISGVVVDVIRDHLPGIDVNFDRVFIKNFDDSAVHQYLYPGSGGFLPGHVILFAQYYDVDKISFDDFSRIFTGGGTTSNISEDYSKNEYNLGNFLLDGGILNGVYLDPRTQDTSKLPEFVRSNLNILSKTE